MKQVLKRSLFLFSLVPAFLFPFYTELANPNLEYHLYKVRDPQTKRAEFRAHMIKIGEHLALAIANTLPTHEVKIETCLKESATHSLLNDSIVVITILRAGLPLFEGFLNIFPDAEGGFLVYQRDHLTLQPVFHASLLPPLAGKTVIIADPMIATGGSVLAALKHIAPKNPAAIFVAGAIAAKQGFQRIHREFPDVRLYAGVMDPILNDKGYIVPGLGDAGDRSYGIKEEE